MNNFWFWNGKATKKPLTEVHRPKRRLYHRLNGTFEGGSHNGNRCHGNWRTASPDRCLVDTLSSSSEEELFTANRTTLEMSRLRLSSERRQGNRRLAIASTTNFIEKDIENGDTLTNLALRYGCRVSEMKRINNLICDREFHGLTTIKVPVKEHSLAEEQLTNENLQKVSSVNECCKEPESHSNTRFIRIHSDAKEFLIQMDTDLERIRQSTKTRKDTLDEVRELLTSKRFYPLVEGHPPKENIPKYQLLVVIAVLITIVFPVLLLLFVEYGKSDG